MNVERVVDHSAIRTNQVFTITLLALAFVLSAPAISGVTGAIMLVSAIFPPLGLFTRVYRHLLKPAGIVRPHAIPDNPEPHRFAQLLGGVMVTLGTLLVVADVSTVGWALIIVVIVLASLNLFAGWCAGCTMYYWLNRLGVPGFTRSRSEVTR